MLDAIFEKHIKQIRKVFSTYMEERTPDNTRIKFLLAVDNLAENDEKAINKYLRQAELFRMMDYKIPAIIFKIGSKNLYVLSMIKHERKPNTAIFKITVVEKTEYELVEEN